MAFTRVRGPGITTDDNYRVGIITATRFVGPFEGDVTGNATSADSVDIGHATNNANYFPVFVDNNGSAKDLKIVNVAQLTYNPSTTVLTAGIFSGSGANLTNLDASDLASGTVPTARLGSGTANNTSFLRGDQTWASNTSTTINNNANNRVITGSGTADTLEAEANLTFNGNNLQFNTTANGHAVILKSTGNYYNKLSFDSGNTAAGGELAYVDFSWDGDKVADIVAIAGSDAGNKDDGHLVFRTSPQQGSIGERLRITSTGLVGINCTPNKQLEVKGTDVAFRLLSTVATGRIGMEFYDTSAQKGYFGYPSSGNDNMSIQQNENADLYFYVNGGERLRIKNNGLIGVGNFSSKLTHITDPLNVDSGIGTCNIGGNYIHLKRYSGGNTNYINAPQNNANLYISADDHIVFGVDHSSSMYSHGTEAIRIISNGKVGIGTDNPADALSVYRTNSGNPIGITIRNTNTNNYSHGRLRIESQNGAKYTDIWTDVPNDACRIGYNSSNALYINGGNAFANTAVTNWHGDYKVFQAGQASLSGKNPQDGSPLYLSNNAYYDTTNSRWEFISTDDASQIEMENGSIKFKNGGTGSANGAITWTTNAWFTQSGNFRFRNGRGVDFGETSDHSGMVSEVLDDYEEGSFTMFFWVSTANFSTNPTMTTNNCRYTKIGNQVSFTAYIAWGNQAAGGSGNLYLGGLPYAVNNYQSYGGIYFGWHNIGGGFSAHEYPTGYINNNSTNIVLMRQGIGAGGGRTYASLNCSAIHGTTGTYSINGTYLTNS